MFLSIKMSPATLADLAKQAINANKFKLCFLFSIKMNPATLADLTKHTISANKLNCSALPRPLQPVQCPFCDMLTWSKDHIEHHVMLIEQEIIDAKEMLEMQDDYEANMIDQSGWYDSDSH